MGNIMKVFFGIMSIVNICHAIYLQLIMSNYIQATYFLVLSLIFYVLYISMEVVGLLEEIKEGRKL